MPDQTKYSQVDIPVDSDVNDIALWLKTLTDGYDPKLVHAATSVVDRDTRYGDLPSGGLVTCASLKAAWLKIDGGWQTLAIDTGWVKTGFQWPNAGWVAGPYNRIRNLNGSVEVRVRALRVGPGPTGSTLATNVGNINDEAVCQVPAGFRPSNADGESGEQIIGAASVGGIGAVAAIYTDPTVQGSIYWWSTMPGFQVQDGQFFNFNATYTLG